MDFALIGRAWADLRFQARAALAFQLLVQLASLALIGPLLAWLAQRLVLLSGEAVISNFALARFLASPAGIGCLVLLLLFTSVTWLIEFTGLTWVAGEAIARRGAPVTGAIDVVVRRVPALALLGARVLLRLLLLVLPFLAAAVLVWAKLLRGHDINYYLAARPPEWHRALLIAGGLAAVCMLAVLWQLGRWIFAIPILLYERASPRRALEQSAQRTRGRLLAVLAPLLAWWLLGGVTARIAGALLHRLGSALLGWAGIDFARVLPLVTLLVAGGLALSFLLNALLISGHQFLVNRMYAEQLDPAARLSAPQSESPAISRRLSWQVLLASLVLLAGGVAVMWWIAARGASAPAVAITAHRGNSRHAPENSLAAFRAAIAAHADYSELDVQRTRDGVVVVLHDGDLMRMAGDPRKIGQLTLQDLATIDIGRKFGTAFAGEHVPTLAAVIDLVRGHMKLNVELKYNAPDPLLAAAVLDVLRDQQFLDQVVITSLSAAALDQVRAIEPRARLGQIVTVAVGDVTRAQADFLSLNSARATPEVLRRAHAAGKSVHVWTVNTPEGMLRMVERGADNLITDYPDLAVRVVQQRRALTGTEQLALRLRVLFSDPPAELLDPQAVTTL
jgi:glycerophosphoryl diester phosphodiesterase